MRFFHAKKSNTCWHCRSEIMVKEIMTRLTFRTTGGFTKGLLFHPECYLKWNEINFTKQYLRWRQNNAPPPKRGPPRIPTTDRPKRRRLLSLMAYHRRKGNETRVKEVNAQIKELEYGSTH